MARGPKQAARPRAQGSPYKVTVRSGAKVRRQRHADLDEALAAVERIADELSQGAASRPVGGTLIRKLEPVQQVVGRIEIAGPRRLRAGVDVRGDGSCEAFTGRMRRRIVEQGGRETASGALRRVLLGSA